MTMPATTEKEADRFCFEDFGLREDAINTIATILGFTHTDIMNEKKKDNPDPQKIERLEADLDRMWKERDDVYFDWSDDAKHYVIDSYSPIIRARLEQTGGGA